MRCDRMELTSLITSQREASGIVVGLLCKGIAAVQGQAAAASPGHRLAQIKAEEAIVLISGMSFSPVNTQVDRTHGGEHRRKNVRWSSRGATGRVGGRWKQQHANTAKSHFTDRDGEHDGRTRGPSSFSASLSPRKEDSPTGHRALGQQTAAPRAPTAAILGI